MNEALYNFVYGIEEKETPNLDQVDDKYFILFTKISKILTILGGVILAFAFISVTFIFIIDRTKELLIARTIIYCILPCCIYLFVNRLWYLLFRFDKVIYPYMVKKNPKAYTENQNLLPIYYYIMDWVKIKEEKTI